MVPDEGATVAAARPVVTGAVIVRRGTIEVGSREDVVSIWAITAAVDHRATFGEYGLLGEVVVRVQLVDVGRHQHTFDVVPRTATDAVAGVYDGLFTGCGSAEVGSPGTVSRPRRFGQFLAVRIGAC